MKKKKIFCYDYPRPAVSSDCIIFLKKNEDFKVLLIRRANDPFKNYWAFPGGFVDEYETTLEAAFRELYEETGITLNELIQLQTYSDIDRDPRGRVISVVYYSILENEMNPKSGDDAKEAKWFSLNEIPELAFDHKMILDFALKQLSI